MKKIFTAIVQGIQSGIPLFTTIKKLIAGEKVDYVDVFSLISEIATVALIFSFVFKKITYTDLLTLLGFLK